ncbi:MAG: (2Fe-2S)-binding protein [Thermoanaerobaculia bacterium]|nr:(2Fe-2S)-binding protein [Thermoanaerobaculia bacterium]
MIVCLCTGATDRDIHDLIDAGARCLCDFRGRGIGDSCGSCHQTIRFLMEAKGVAVRELCFEEAVLSRMRDPRVELPPASPGLTCRIGA